MKRYSMVWQNKFSAHNLSDLIKALDNATVRLREMMRTGVKMKSLGGDYCLLFTYDPKTAEHFGFRITEDDPWGEPEYGGEAGEGS